MGLGNPGEEYSETRHNLGFLAVEAFARGVALPAGDEACDSLIFRGRVAGDEVVVARPQTFMNRSGDAAACLLGLFGAAPGDLLVVCDDAALDLGILRIRPSGSDGGHRGLRSIIHALGTEEFPRLRIGIRTAPVAAGNLAEEVLSPFPPGEAETALAQASRAAECIQAVLEQGIEKAMNVYNRRQPNAQPDSTAC